MSKFNNLSVETTLSEDIRDIKDRLSKLEVIESLSARITANEKELASLSKAMSDLQDTNTDLKEEVKKLNEDLESRPKKADLDALKSELSAFKAQINDKHILPLKEGLETVREGVDAREQASRNYCVRINGLFVPEAQAKNISEYDHAKLCMAAVHEMLGPVLNKKKDSIGFSVEHPSDYIETAHVLPIPKSGNYMCPPIFVRFKNRNLRNLILANKNFAKVRKIDCEKGTKSYRIAADLTKRRYAVMQKLIQSEKFEKVWHLDGKIVKFITKKSEKVFKVKMFEITPNQIIEKYC